MGDRVSSVVFLSIGYVTGFASGMWVILVRMEMAMKKTKADLLEKNEQRQFALLLAQAKVIEAVQRLKNPTDEDQPREEKE